jgi:hypothetical protein
MEEYKSIACDGNNDFVFGRSPRSGVFFSYKTNPSNKTFIKPKISFSVDGEKGRRTTKQWHQLVADAIETENIASIHGQRLLTKYYIMNKMMASDLEDLRVQESHCVDVDLEQADPVFKMTLQYQTKRATASTCKAFAGGEDKNECSWGESRLLRFLCPKTCGCDKYTKGLFWLDGCPSACAEHRQFERGHSLELFERKVATHNTQISNIKSRKLIPPSGCSNLLHLGQYLKTGKSEGGHERYVKFLKGWWKRYMVHLPTYEWVMKEIFPQLSKYRCPIRGGWHIATTGEDSGSVTKHAAYRILCGVPSFAFWCPLTCDCPYQCRQKAQNYTNLCYNDCSESCGREEVRLYNNGTGTSLQDWVTFHEMVDRLNRPTKSSSGTPQKKLFHTMEQLQTIWQYLQNGSDTSKTL